MIARTHPAAHAVNAAANAKPNPAMNTSIGVMLMPFCVLVEEL